MMTKQLTEIEKKTVEAFVDAVGIAEFLGSLSELCFAKASHIRANWQDEALAARWVDLEIALNRLARKAGREL